MSQLWEEGEHEHLHDVEAVTEIKPHRSISAPPFSFRKKQTVFLLFRPNFNNQHKSSFPKRNHYVNTKLEVRKIPRELNNIAKLNEHFSKFGTIVNIQVRRTVSVKKQLRLHKFKASYNAVNV